MVTNLRLPRLILHLFPPPEGAPPPPPTPTNRPTAPPPTLRSSLSLLPSSPRFLFQLSHCLARSPGRMALRARRWTPEGRRRGGRAGDRSRKNVQVATVAKPVSFSSLLFPSRLFASLLFFSYSLRGFSSLVEAGCNASCDPTLHPVCMNRRSSVLPASQMNAAGAFSRFGLSSSRFSPRKCLYSSGSASPSSNAPLFSACLP